MYSISNGFYIFGANTDIGKTVFSAALARYFTQYFKLNVHYIKPIDTDGMSSRGCMPSLFKSTILCSYNCSLSPHRVQKHGDENDEWILKKIESIFADKMDEFIFIEGSGGVASPSLDGSLQCDLYSNFKLPIIFVADFKLGGISNTIASLALAKSYGFDVVCILCFSGEHENAKFLEKYYQNFFPVFEFKNFLSTDSFDVFFNKNKNIIQKSADHILNFYPNEIKKIEQCMHVFEKHAWWPFTQHKNIRKKEFIYRAQKDSFEILDIQQLTGKTNGIYIQKKYDATQSWWTQNLGHGNQALAKEVSYTAARYGHVMYPGHMHIPAADLIQKCLETVGKGWANRVFFSDNGSTAVEVALKMAFRLKFGMDPNIQNVVVLGLKDSYHGDTLGAMDATEPNTFKTCEYWYHKSRGIWFSYPQVFFKENQILIVMENHEIKTSFKTFDELFDFEIREHTELALMYSKYFQEAFLKIPKEHSIGACLFEGLVQGACGMIFIDPLFLRLFFLKCESLNIPVVVDEVFSGFWRLGFVSASHALKIKPHIACFAKGLTGGLLPMGATLAREEVFQAFLGNGLDESLLHGHSYTGNPLGAAAASKAIELLQETLHFNKQNNKLENLWDDNQIKEISFLKNVKGVFALGTLLSITLNSKTQNYLSNDVAKILDNFAIQNQIDMRPLGNVLYLIAGFETSKAALHNMVDTIISVLKECHPA